MVFNSSAVAAVARASAELWQHVACNPERLRSGEVLDLICCLPVRHLRRIALCLFSFFCLPVPMDLQIHRPTLSSPGRPPSYYSHHHYYLRYYGSSSSSSSLSSSSSDDDDDVVVVVDNDVSNGASGYHSHSD